MVALSRKSTYVQTAHRANVICKTTVLDVTRRLLQTKNIMVSSYAQKKKKTKEKKRKRKSCDEKQVCGCGIFLFKKYKISHALVSSPDR